MNIFCKLGFHQYFYEPMATSFQRSFPETGNILRKCQYCGRLEYLADDKIHWTMGVKGLGGIYEYNKEQEIQSLSGK